MYGDDYASVLLWKDEHMDKINNLKLSKLDNYNNYVQYLPQKYIEKVCTYKLFLCIFEVGTAHNYYNYPIWIALGY